MVQNMIFWEPLMVEEPWESIVLIWCLRRFDPLEILLGSSLLLSLVYSMCM